LTLLVCSKKHATQRAPAQENRYINPMKIASENLRLKEKKKTNNRLRLDVSNQNPDDFLVSFLQNFQINNSMSVLFC